jgi:hypothetical protein
VFDDIKKFLNEESPVHGLEFLLDFSLLSLRWVSLSYLMRLPFERPRNIPRRNNAVDCYCFTEFVFLCLLLIYSQNCILNSISSIYILFEIYLILFNIFFLRKFPDINYESPSYERVVLLMLLNVAQVTVAFAVLYRTWSPSPIPWRYALSQSIHVLGTVEAPAQRGLLVDSQIFSDLMLLVIFIANFVGRVGISGGSSTTDAKNATKKMPAGGTS